jgi:hypothetical protein
MQADRAVHRPRPAIPPAAAELAQGGGPPRSPARGPSAAAVEVAVCAGFVAIGLLMLAANLPIGVQWDADGPQAGYFPFRVGAIIAVCGLLAGVSALRRAEARATPFVEPARFRSVLAVGIPTAAYVLAIQWLGLYVASFAFLIFFMRAIGRYSWLRALAVSAPFVAVLFWTFETQFLMPLAKGPLEAWLGY